MSPRLQKRKDNAIRVAQAIQSLIEQGYAVFSEHGSLVKAMLIEQDGVYEPIGENSRLAHFIFDEGLDNGFHTSIKEYNASFKGWKVVPPSAGKLSDHIKL